jgi:hypothetical protein
MDRNGITLRRNLAVLQQLRDFSAGAKALPTPPHRKIKFREVLNFPAKEL